MLILADLGHDPEPWPSEAATAANKLEVPGGTEPSPEITILGMAKSCLGSGGAAPWDAGVQGAQTPRIAGGCGAPPLKDFFYQWELRLGMGGAGRAEPSGWTELAQLSRVDWRSRQS